MTLAEAQAAKHELICRKLGLHERPGMRLLDVGCGWGSMAMHAAAHHDAQVVGVTISAGAGRRWPASGWPRPGSTDRVEIRLQDYRDLGGETFDAISSIGMFEHVGAARIGRVLRHAPRPAAPAGSAAQPRHLASAGGSKLGSRTFIGRYVFPDGELIDVGEVVAGHGGTPASRCATSSRCASTTPRRCAPGSPTWRRSWDEAVALVGRGPGPGLAALHGGSARRLRRRRHRPCTRCSASARRPTAAAACRRRAPAGAEGRRLDPCSGAVDGPTERGERSLLHGFAERRVGMDDGGDVLQHRAHLDRRGERRGQLADAGADGLHPDHQVVGASGDDAHEAVGAVERQRPPVGRRA